MKYLNFLQTFGEIYDCDTYSSGNYNEDACITQTGSGQLTNTGTNVIVGVAGGAVLVIAAVILFVMTLKKKKKKN